MPPPCSLCPPSQLPLSIRGIWEAEETRNEPQEESRDNRKLAFLKACVRTATSRSRSPWWRWDIVGLRGKRGFYIQRGWETVPFSPLLPPSPFIKPISILKAVGNPSVQSTVSYLTQCSPSLTDSLLTDNPTKEASPASGGTMGHPGLKGARWSPRVGPSCVLGDSSVAAHSRLQLPDSGHSHKPWPLCFKLFWPLKPWGLVLRAACSCGRV